MAVFVYPLGVFTLGALWGTILGLILNGLFLSRIGYVICQCNTLLWAVVPFLGVLFGMLAIVVHRHKEADPPHSARKVVIYAKTSFTGSYLLVKGIAHFAGNFPPELSMAKSVTLPLAYYIYLGAIVVTAVLGIFIQMRFTHFEHCGSDSEAAPEIENRPLFGASAKAN